MLLAIVTPYYFPSVRGNSITVQRIESGLRDRGLRAQVLSLDRQDRSGVLAGLRRLRPDVVHGFHATLAGPITLEAAGDLGIPAVVTLTGTDVNQDLYDPAHRAVVLAVVEAAQAVVVFHEAIRDRLLCEAPALRPRVHVIGQTVRCEEGSYDLRRKLGLDPRDFVVFQAAGIRRVKNIPAVIPPLVILQERHPRLRYVLAGPVVERDEGERVEAMLHGLSWASHPGALSHGEICAALPQVEVVVNSSLSEGGMSNAILEAMSKGVPVLASDIEGNRTVVEDGHDGFLFRSEADFLEKMERLLVDPALRHALGRRGMRKIESQFPFEGEIGGHLALYHSLAAKGA
jgi:glycosyltransferase involved in cell wall biosynthesis